MTGPLTDRPVDSPVVIVVVVVVVVVVVIVDVGQGMDGLDALCSSDLLETNGTPGGADFCFCCSVPWRSRLVAGERMIAFSNCALPPPSRVSRLRNPLVPLHAVCPIN